MYIRPIADSAGVVDDTDFFEDFIEDVHDELKKFGQIENIVVCENVGDHMVC
jgi:hypothetical protein